MEAGLGPHFVQGGAGVPVELPVAGAKDNVIAGHGCADLADGNARLGEKRNDVAGICGADLENGTELFAEEQS